MKWENLRKNKCPRCGKPLMYLYIKMKCLNYEKCNFEIGEIKFRKMIDALVEDSKKTTYNKNDK